MSTMVVSGKGRWTKHGLLTISIDTLTENVNSKHCGGPLWRSFKGIPLLLAAQQGIVVKVWNSFLMFSPLYIFQGEYVNIILYIYILYICMIYRYMCLTPKCQDMFAQPPRVGDWRPVTSFFSVENLDPQSVHFTPSCSGPV